MHPKNVVRKTYHVWVSGYSTQALTRLTDSIEIDGRATKPAKVKVLSQKQDVAMLEFVLEEGRNRQIRRLCQHAGVTVTRLKRIREGALELGDLPVGKWRMLTEEEVACLQE